MQWQNFSDSKCLFISFLQLRNKPKEPPKVPKAAPFFLPTVAGLEPKFATETDKDKEEEVIVFTFSSWIKDIVYQCWKEKYWPEIMCVKTFGVVDCAKNKTNVSYQSDDERWRIY